MKVPSRVLAIAVGLAALVVYLATLAPDMLGGDSGEFQFAAPLLGIVHATGYPLYLILAKVVTLLPFGSVAYRVNLFSALCASLAVAACYLVALQLARADAPRVVAHASAAAAALALAFTPTFWAQATEAEVYALNSVFVLCLIGLALRLHAEPGGTKTQFWFAAALGLALAHHRTTLLLLPALAAFLALDVKSLLANARPPILVAALLLPLLLYIYTPLRYEATSYTHTVLDAQHVIVTLERTPAAFAAQMLGTGFGGALYWDGISGERLAGTPGQVVDEFGVLGGMLALLGLLVIVRRREWRLCALLFGIVGAVALFDAAYHIGDISDFYTPIYLVAALLIALGVGALGRVHNALPLAGLALPLVLLVGNWPAMSLHDDVRARWNELLAGQPAPGAVLISNDRDEMTPLYYLELVEGVRPDLVGLFPLIASGARLSNVVALTQYALDTPRPVYFVKPMDDLSIKFRLQSAGPLQRVIGNQDMTPQHALARESPLLKLAGWSREDSGRETTGDGKSGLLRVTLFWQAMSTSRPDFKTWVHVLDGEGRMLAQSDHVPGGVYYPPSQWTAGETLHDEHDIVLPNGPPSQNDVLVAGVYLSDGRGLLQVDLGTLGP